MAAEAKLQDYLDEIRRDVCSICIERPPGGPPCHPLGKNCGVEMHLPELIEAVREVHSGLLEPYLDHNRQEICSTCRFLHSSICPCPMDYLLLPIVEAVEKVDERRRICGEEVVKAMRKSAPGQSWVGIVRRAYQEGEGTWTGCDWPTKFGKTELNLNGWTSAEAEAMAVESLGLPAVDDWAAATQWLARVEGHAEQAEYEAEAAVLAAEQADWPKALEHARRAWLIEVGTGRLRWHGFPLTWQPLRQAVEAAAQANGIADPGPVLEAVGCR